MSQTIDSHLDEIISIFGRYESRKVDPRVFYETVAWNTSELMEMAALALEVNEAAEALLAHVRLWAYGSSMPQDGGSCCKITPSLLDKRCAGAREV